MRISLLFPIVLLSAPLVVAQESLRLDDGGWQPVRRGGQTYLTAPMTPVRLSVRANRPENAGTAAAPVQVTVGGDTGNAIEASAFVRPIQPSRPTDTTSTNVQAEAPYVPDPVTPASSAQPANQTNTATAANIPAYLTVDAAPTSEAPTSRAPRSEATTSRAQTESNAAQASKSQMQPSSPAPAGYADTPPRLPPTPPQWNDPALEVARQSLSTSPQSVYWQGQTPADLAPRLPSGSVAQPAPLSAQPSPYMGGAAVAPQTFSPAVTSPAMPSCDASLASPYTPYYPQTVASPSVAAYGAVAPMPMTASAHAGVAGAGPEIRRGLLGQPVLRVPGQPLRNFLRFVTP